MRSILVMSPSGPALPCHAMPASQPASQPARKSRPDLGDVHSRWARGAEGHGTVQQVQLAGTSGRTQGPLAGTSRIPVSCKGALRLCRVRNPHQEAHTRRAAGELFVGPCGRCGCASADVVAAGLWCEVTLEHMLACLLIASSEKLLRLCCTKDQPCAIQRLCVLQR